MVDYKGKWLQMLNVNFDEKIFHEYPWRDGGIIASLGGIIFYWVGRKAVIEKL